MHCQVQFTKVVQSFATNGKGGRILSNITLFLHCTLRKTIHLEGNGCDVDILFRFGYSVTGIGDDKTSLLLFFFGFITLQIQ